MKKFIVYITQIKQYPGLIKIGLTSDLPRRLISLNCPGYIHEVLQYFEYKEQYAAVLVEAQLQKHYHAFIVREDGCTKEEYFRVDLAEVEKIKKSIKHLESKIVLPRGIPKTIQECIKLGLVELRATIYDGYKNNGTKLFKRDMKTIGVIVPEEALYINRTNAEAPRGPWTGDVWIKATLDSVATKGVRKQISRITKGKSKAKVLSDGTLHVCSCSVFRFIAPLLWT